KRERRSKVRVAQNAAQPRISFLAPTARGEEPADDVVKGAGSRKLRGVDAQLDRKLLRDPFVKKAGPAVRLDLEELRADDGNDSALLDEVEQVLPRILVERADGVGDRRYAAHAKVCRSGVRASAGEVSTIPQARSNRRSHPKSAAQLAFSSWYFVSH